MIDFKPDQNAGHGQGKVEGLPVIPITTKYHNRKPEAAKPWPRDFSLTVPSRLLLTA